MSLLDAVQTARGSSSVSPTSKPTSSGTSSLLGAVQVARGGASVTPTPTASPKPIETVSIAKPQNESLLSKIGGYVASNLNSIIAKIPSNTQDKVKMATNIASKIVTEQPQIKTLVKVARKPVVKKYAEDTADLAVDAIKKGIDTIKGAGQLTAPYQIYRAAIGNPVKPQEFVKSVVEFGLDIIGLQWRLNPLAPVVGAKMSQEKQLRQMAQNGKLKWDDVLKLAVGGVAGPIGRAAAGASIVGSESLVEGVNTQPGVGETFTDNVKLAQAIDIIFLGTMFVAPIAEAKVVDLNVKASNFLDRIKPLDISPNATMKEVTEAVRSKMKLHPDAFTNNPTQAGMKARTEITDALNAFKEAGFIDKKYAQAFDFFAKKLGIEIPPLATETKIEPKQITDGKAPEVVMPKEKQAPEVLKNKIQEYRTQFPNEKILNADNVREVYKPEGYNRVNSNDFHPVSSETTKAIFNQDVAALKPGDNYLFTAGASGVGKSSSLKLAPEVSQNIAAGLDSNFSSESSLQKLKQVIDKGANTGILFTYRDPTDAWENGIVKRAINPDNGRVVPLEVFLKNLENSPKYTLKAQELYGDKIHLQVVDNSKGKGNAVLVDNPVDFLKNIRYNIEDVKQKAITYVQNGIKNGSIKPETGKALLGEYSTELSKQPQPQRQEQQPSPVTDTSSSNNVVTTTSPHLLKNQDGIKLESQKEDGWCGPTALQYALKEQGLDASQEELAKGMGATISQGADPRQITAEAKKQGLQAETIQGEDAQKTLATLDQALSEGKSVILDFLDGKDLQNDGHYVLYQGRENGNITVMDPQTGKPRTIDEQKFIDQWKDTTIKGNLFKRWATILDKKPQILGGKPEQPKKIVGRSKYATTGIREVLSSAESPQDSVNKLDAFVKDFVKGADQSNMADLRAGLVKEIDSLVGGTGNYKRDYAVRVAMRDDIEVGGLVRALEKHISDIDATIRDYPEKNVSPADDIVGSETSITIPAEVNQAGQTPVGQGKLRESTAYAKIKSRIAEEAQLDVKYNKVNLNADIEKAVQFLDENPKAAVRVALGLEKAPEGQLERNITIATAEKALADGDIALWNQIESSGSLRQTRRGQEIVADRGRFNDNSPHTFMKELISRRLDKLGYSFQQAIKDAGKKVGSLKESAIAKIDERTAKLREKLKKDQGKIKLAQDIIDLLRC